MYHRAGSWLGRLEGEGGEATMQGVHVSSVNPLCRGFIFAGKFFGILPVKGRV